MARVAPSCLGILAKGVRGCFGVSFQDTTGGRTNLAASSVMKEAASAFLEEAASDVRRRTSGRRLC